MKKALLWGIMVCLLLMLLGMAWYADHYGNPKIQEVALDLLKVSVGAFLGAWANEFSK
jgi:hypothetical protein